MLNLIRASLGILPDSIFPENALVTFGITIGLGVSSTSPTWRDTSAALSLLSGLYLILQAIVSFGLGGYIAGHTHGGVDAA
jgi:hypothetical protein